MSGKFVPASEVVRDQLDWGSLAWCCRPVETGAQKLVVMEVTLGPGGGHAFHKHPGQEEVIYVIEGWVEQWLDQQKQILGPGDSVFITGDTVHASFNTGEGNAKMLAIVSPCVNQQDGYEVTELANEEPWSGLRK